MPNQIYNIQDGYITHPNLPDVRSRIRCICNITHANLMIQVCRPVQLARPRARVGSHRQSFGSRAPAT